MVHTLSFSVVTPEGVAYKDDAVDQVSLPTAEGQITVLANHRPLVTLLRPGEMIIVKGGVSHHFAVSHGVAEIRPKSEVVVLADTAERAEDIDLEAAEAARARAQKMLEEKEHIDDVEYARFQSLLDRELNRIRVRRKHRG
ncbi:MAG: F-type H+-transporting ATPase subunit epsilon [Parcubacteria group bacterium Greene0416_14]|nr:MAG: F-type H+-transporting ATPase subunit epsilon [Parcubacteria group bacterium Greene0416_14]TSD01487.1 MAG: F-type H+-transporting ATPase subunit epsilon [Parcubacteria group bacterium Greene1014_15]TSD07904.1 MAG: F-type H+-transporting ATPase subunit epsilon [Parcubacteria group bacterium Greene0714_4]